MTWETLSARRAVRRVAGLCVGSLNCRGRTDGHRFCPRHRRLNAKYQRTSHASLYMRKKTTGVCTQSGCHDAACDTSVMCRPHADAHAQRLQSPTMKEQRLRASQRCRARRRRAGLCETCGLEPLESATKGDKCLQRLRDEGRARRVAAAQAAGRKMRVIVCKRCGVAGHTIRRCLDVPEATTLPRVEEFLRGGEHPLA